MSSHSRRQRPEVRLRGLRTAAAVGLTVAGACATFVGAAPQPREGYAVGSDSVRLFYRIDGAGGDTLVVVNGWQGNDQSYLAADLAPLARGRTVIFYDQRGSGRSSAVADTARLGVASHAADLEAIREHFGIERMAILAHSGGGAIAAVYAARHPAHVARLVLVAPPPPTDAFARMTGERFAARVDPATLARIGALSASLPSAMDPEAVCRELMATALPRAYFADSARYRRMRGDFCAQPPERIRTQQARLAAFRASLPREWTEVMGAIPVPVLVIHGDHDAIPAASSAAWARGMRNARLLVLPDADHLPWVEQPDAFFAAVDAFLRGGWPTGAARP